MCLSVKFPNRFNLHTVVNMHHVLTSDLFNFYELKANNFSGKIFLVVIDSDTEK